MSGVSYRMRAWYIFLRRKIDIICHTIRLATKLPGAKMYYSSTVFGLINIEEPFHMVFNFICLTFITFFNYF
jgi:hypothetical protein